MKSACFRNRSEWRLPLVILSLGVAAARADSPVLIPTEFDADRFFATPTTADGQTLRLLVDTGGGLLFFSDAAQRLGLEMTGVNLENYKGMACKFPTFAPGKGVPALNITEGVIPVAPAPFRRNISWITPDIDGVLGASWFLGGVWTLDFVGKQVLHHPGGKVDPPDKAQRLPLGLRKGGVQEFREYVRVEVTIAGKTYDLMLSTGSSVAVNPEALSKIGDGGPAIRPTSLISTSIFADWQKEHPDWRVVTNAEKESGEPMIEVPAVKLGELTVGPLWFTRRSDENFRDHFSDWTDKPVVGALGPDALRGMRVLLDYPKETAWLEKIK